MAGIDFMFKSSEEMKQECIEKEAKRRKRAYEKMEWCSAKHW